MPVVSFAAVEHQPIAHRGKRHTGAREKLCEQDLRANVPLFSVGALTPLNHLGPGEFIVEEISLVLIGVGHDRRLSNKVFHFRQDRWEPWSVLEIGWPNPVDLDGLRVDRPIRVDPGAPRLALAPAIAFAQHFDETDFDDDARGLPGERLLKNELGVGGTLASRLRVEGDEAVETVEEIRHVHGGAPKQRQFVRVSLIEVTAKPLREEDRRLSAARDHQDVVSAEQYAFLKSKLLRRGNEGFRSQDSTRRDGPALKPFLQPARMQLTALKRPPCQAPPDAVHRAPSPPDDADGDFPRLAMKSVLIANSRSAFFEIV